MDSDIIQHRKAIERKYLLYELSSSLFFIGAVWLYFYRLFITDAEVGILDAFAFGIGIIAEVPSGALADKFGRSRITRLGLILGGCGFLIQAIGGGFIPLFIGQSILMIGSAFISGADEALFFSKLNYDRESIEWRKLVTKGSQISLIATFAATTFGGWLYMVNPYIPWILQSLAYFVTAQILWNLKDEDQEKTATENQNFLISTEMKTYFKNILDGFKQFGSPELLRYVPIILTIQGLFYTASWGLLQIILLSRFHFDPFWGSVVVATSSIITIAILHFNHRYADKMHEKQVLSFIAILAAISLLISIPDIGLWGGGVIFILCAGERILYPFLSDVINKHAHEKHRATTISVASFLRLLPYVILAPIIGTLNDHGQLYIFLLIWPILIVLALVFYYFQSLRKS